MVHKMQFSEDCVFNMQRRGYNPRQQRGNQGTGIEKRRKYLSNVALKTEHAALLCADVKRIAINGKRGCCMW